MIHPRGALLVLTAFLLTPACHRAPNAVSPPTQQGVSRTFRSPSGKIYTRTLVAPPDDDEPISRQPLTPGVAANTDDYQGTARRDAKTSIGAGPTMPFNDLNSVLDSLIPDAQMRSLDISHAATSERLPQEQGLVTVTAFLYASSRESDNDFHCIVGSDSTGTTRFMNVEVSGLPPAASPYFDPLQAARNQYKAFFTANGNALPTQGYDKYDPPIPIVVTGSLFFDVDHVPPAVGPAGMKPQTAWEIHPVSDIRFEP